MLVAHIAPGKPADGRPVLLADNFGQVNQLVRDYPDTFFYLIGAVVGIQK
jgi:hypothetical protein